MLIANNFQAGVCQYTIFTRGFTFNPSKTLGVLLEKYSDLLDGEPQVLPTNNIQLPPEIPLITLRNSSNTMVVAIGPRRFDFTRSPNPNEPLPIPETISLAGEMARKYLGKMSAIPCRLGFSISRFAPERVAAKSLSEHFCHQKWIAGPLNRPAEFEMHALKKFRLSNLFEVNSWVRCKTGSLTAVGSEGAAIIVEQDINTFAEGMDSSSFDVHEMERFFNAVPPEMDSILSQYFPVELQ